MLPTINLQLSEPARFDTSTDAFTPEASDEPTAVFSEVLAVRTTSPAEAGDSLPPTGKALPLLPDPAAVDPEVIADIVLEAGEIFTPNPEDIAPLTDGEFAPTSVVAVPEVLDVTLDVETTPDTGVRPAEELLVTREIELPVQGVGGKGIEPATPPGPVEPGKRGETALLRPNSDAPAALLRDAAPQTGDDAALRPILAAAAPPISADPNATSRRTDVLEPGARVRSALLDVPAAKSPESRAPVAVETAPLAVEPAKPGLEPLNQATQLAAQTPQANAQNAAGIADSLVEGATELRSAGDAAALTRPAAEPQAPRQIQSILQPINTPVQQPDWDQAVSERIVMMANNKLQQAEIRLTPAELGPLRIHVSVDDGAANVSIQAQHAMTRDAIEQALPRLREMFAEQGLSLGQASVGHEGAADGGDARSSELNAATGSSADVNVEEAEVEVVRSRLESGLVDTFV